MSILQIRDLKLELSGTPVLDGLTMDFADNLIHAVVGPNGAGKSTLAHTIMGLSGYRDISGDILFKGESIRNLGTDERARRGITLGWQEPARFEGLRISDFIGASAVGGKQTRDLAADSLRKVGMEPDLYLDRAVDKTLSGGERKKVELASILAMKPEVAILDEPDSGIDIDSLERIFEAVRLLQKGGATVLLITHSLAVLEQAQHAFLICCGKVQEEGDVRKIGNYFGKRCLPCGHQNEPEINGTLQ